MVTYISSWARQIIVSVVIAIILEMILSPNSKNTKYIKTVIGIYVVYSIIAPGISLVGGNLIDFSNIDYENYFANSEIYQNIEESINDIENDSFEEKYKLNLKQDIENKLREKNYIVSNIDLKINLESGEEYGRIESIEISLSKGDSKEEEEKILINKINIGNTNNQNKITKTEEEDIKSFINQEYGVEINSISLKY